MLALLRLGVLRRTIPGLAAFTVLASLLAFANSVVSPTPALAAPPAAAVSVGYADNARSSGFFPTPWAGSPGVIFEGCQPVSSCTYDGGAVEVVNTSGSPFTINSLTVSFGTCVYNIWPGNVAVPAGGSAIYAQETSGESNGCAADGTFDTSDVGANGAPWASNCTQSGAFAQVNLTINSAPESSRSPTRNRCSTPGEWI